MSVVAVPAGFIFWVASGCVVENNFAPSRPTSGAQGESSPNVTAPPPTSVAAASASSASMTSPTPIATPDATTNDTTSPSSTPPQAAGEPPPPPDTMLSCMLDADCVAVPKNGCCHHGHKVAINTKSTDAYKMSFTCADPRPICPAYVVQDTRVAECSNETHKCEMVGIDQIKCGGFIGNHHACPDTYQCKLPHLPDVPGSCVK
jgi:hypothetical protein